MGILVDMGQDTDVLVIIFCLFDVLSLCQNLTEVMTTGLRQLVDNQERMFEQIKYGN